MKATDLRIGNFVMNTTSSQIRSVKDWKVNSINHYKAVCGRASNEQEVFKYDNLEGIPLTEEWLTKFGFEISGSSEMLCYTLKINGGYLQWFDDGSFSLAADLKKNAVCPDAEIHFVHQLQNLYFALTGEELTIKEPAHEKSK